MKAETATWAPAAFQLAIGDRVRVRLGGECPGRRWPSLYPEQRPQLIPVGHFDFEDGCSGTIAHVDNELLPINPPGHPYMVKLEVEPERWLPFARAELTALLGAADAADEQGGASEGG